MTTALKIFDIDLNHINISSIRHAKDNCHVINLCYSVDSFNNVYLSTSETELILQFPALQIIDFDTDKKLIVTSFNSYDILYNDIFMILLKS